jgi:hypothetical protein
VDGLLDTAGLEAKLKKGWTRKKEDGPKDDDEVIDITED